MAEGQGGRRRCGRRVCSGQIIGCSEVGPLRLGRFWRLAGHAEESSLYPVSSRKPVGVLNKGRMYLAVSLWWLCEVGPTESLEGSSEGSGCND